jgi:hypothetical protein
MSLMRSAGRALDLYNNDPTVEMFKAEIILVHMRQAAKTPLIRYHYDFKEQQLVEMQSVEYDEVASQYADMLYRYGQAYYPELFPQDHD